MDLRHSAAPAVALAALSAAVAGGFTRLVTGDAWLPLVVGAALLPHAIGLVLRGRASRWTPWAWAGGLVAYLTWAVVPATTWLGLPTAATARELGRRLDAGLATLREQAAPVAPRPGVVLLAVGAVWITAVVADLLAFSRRASIGALAPGITLFIWIAALAPASGPPAAPAAALVVTGATFLALQHQALQTRQREAIGSTRVIPAPGAAVAAVALAAVAALVGAVLAPLLPGAGADPLVDLRDERGSSTYQTAVPPLVDVAQNLRRGERVELFSVAAPAPQYWRTVALDDYSPAGGGQWTLQAAGSDIDRGLEGTPSRDVVEQHFRIGNLGERWMPAAFAPVRVSRPGTLVVRESLTLVTEAPSVAGLAYRVASSPPPTDLTDAQRRATAAAPPPGLARYTELPAEVPASVRELAETVTAGATNAYDRARLLRDFFRDGSFTYDPTVDLDDALDATLAFLRLRRGFCVQFASTYALMARAVGIPARVAVGFTPGTLDPSTGRYRVSNHEAHAWPEVWLAGVGWTNRFEPTPPSAQPGGGDLPGDTAAAPVPAPAPVEATPPTTVAGPPADPSPAPPGPAPGDGRVSAPVPGGSRSWATTGFLLAGAALLASAVVASIPWRKWRRRVGRSRRADPAERVAGAWEEAVDRLRELGGNPTASETPAEIAARVDDLVGIPASVALADLADAHTTAQFAGRPVSPAAADDAWHVLGRFTRAAGGHVGFRRRARARVTPLRRR